MAVKCSTRSVDGVTVVDLSGRITLGEASSTLRETIRDLVSGGQKNIALNLGDVTYVDHSGIGEMVSSYTYVSNCMGRLVLCAMQKKVHDLLQITKLYTVFSVYRTEEEAVKSFK